MILKINKKKTIPTLPTNIQPRRKKIEYEWSTVPIGSPRLFINYQMLPKIATFPKWIPKGTPRKLFRKGIIESCSAHSYAAQFFQLFAKLFSKSALQSWSPKLP